MIGFAIPHERFIKHVVLGVFDSFLLTSHFANPSFIMSEPHEDEIELKGVKDYVPTLSTVPHRVKVTSDVTGLANKGNGVSLQASVARGSRKTVSDLILILHNHEEGQKRGRRRSASDVITKFSSAPCLGNADLRMAEEVQAHGTFSERKAKGVSETGYDQRIEQQEGVDPPDDFFFNDVGLTTEEATKRLTQYGRNELPEKRDPKWLIFLRTMWAPMPIMIWIAIIIEIGISNYLDMGILLLIQFTNAFISFYETTKAGDAIAALKSSLKPQATCKRDGTWSVIEAGLIVPGDLTLLASGSTIPADCRVNDSEIDVDQAALTGESLPVTFYKGDSCKMGSTVVRGEVEATVEFTGASTFFGKTASLLQETHEPSHIQIVLMTIMLVLVGISLLLCAINFAYLLVKGVQAKEAISFTVVLLVASIPLAIEIVTTTTLAIGSKNMAKHGAIVARLAAIEDLAGMSILCSDKTGTLTLNQMMLQDDTPIYLDGENQETVLKYAAMAAKWKEPARDALDRLTLGAVNFSLLEPYEQIHYLPFDPQIKRTEGTVVDTRTGEEFKTSKGAPHVLLALLDSDDNDVREAVERDVSRLGAFGIRALAVARTVSDGRWKMVGLLTFLDPPRPDTLQTVREAKAYGVVVKMITGDHLLIAKNTARQLEMGDRIFTAERLPLLDAETKEKPKDLSLIYGDLCLAADGFAQVFPEHKYLIVECLREMHYKVGMTGDGVNDAPAMKRADVGIAVAGATDAARAAADIVLTEPGLSTIINGIVYAREVFQRVNNFITYRIAATLQLLLFFFIAILSFHPADFTQPDNLDRDWPWPKYFHMPVIMLMLITLLNDGTLITIAYDNAKASTTPDRWNLPALFLTSCTLGAVSCISSLLLLYLVLDSWSPNSFLRKLGMTPVQYGNITTAIYLKVSVSDFLTLFSARTGPRFFWQVPPASILLIGGAMSLFLSSMLSIFWPDVFIDTILVQGLRTNIGLFFFVWIYSLFFWLVQDTLKVYLYKWMNQVNFNNIAVTGVVVLPESTLELIKELDIAIKDEKVVEDHR
jgi:H+-transporting ATPase